MERDLTYLSAIGLLGISGHDDYHPERHCPINRIPPPWNAPSIIGCLTKLSNTFYWEKGRLFHPCPTPIRVCSVNWTDDPPDLIVDCSFTNIRFKDKIDDPLDLILNHIFMSIRCLKSTTQAMDEKAMPSIVLCFSRIGMGGKPTFAANGTLVCKSLQGDPSSECKDWTFA